MARIDDLLEKMEEYISQNKYEDLMDRFFYSELEEKHQETVDTPEEFTQDDIPKFLKDGELFTENKNYMRDKRNFMLFENGGNLIVTVDGVGDAKGTITSAGTFSFPLEDENAKKAFAIMLLYLQDCTSVKFPELDFNAD